MKFKLLSALFFVSSYAGAAPAAGLGRVESVSRLGTNLTVGWDGSFAAVPGPEFTIKGLSTQIDQCEKYALLALTSSGRLLLKVPTARDIEQTSFTLSGNQQCGIKTTDSVRQGSAP